MLDTLSIYPSPQETEKLLCIGLHWWFSGRESACQCRAHGFDPWSRKIPRASERLSPCVTTTEPTPESPRRSAHEELLQREACAPKLESSPSPRNYRKPVCSNKDRVQPKINEDTELNMNKVLRKLSRTQETQIRNYYSIVVGTEMM